MNICIENEESDFKTLNDVFVLELATMRWSAPSIYGEPPLPRKYHHGQSLFSFIHGKIIVYQFCF